MMQLVPKIEVIQQKRCNEHLSQQQLSLKAGLSGNSIYRIEAKKVKTVNHLRAREIAKALNCKTSDLFSAVKKNITNGGIKVG